MEELRKDDVLTLYGAFIKLCDFIECEVECGKCPMWETTCRGHNPNGEAFGESLYRIRKALGIKRP